MTRIVVALEPGTIPPNQPATFVRLLRFSGNIPNALHLIPITVTPPTPSSWATPNAVQAHGLAIRTALSGHPAVQQMLQQIRQTPPSGVQPLYFQLTAPDAEQVYWETLFDQQSQRFLALDRRWPVGRIADAVTAQPPPPFQPFAGVIRLLAILSAQGISARNEWNRLRRAVEDARALGLPIKLALWLGEELLADDIQAEIDAGTLSDTTVDLLGRNVTVLEQTIDRAEPHLIHFFCHGGAANGTSWLEFASALDWTDTGPTPGDLRLDVDLLSALPAVRNAWLVVLNCCEGAAQSGAQVHSMAHKLVAAGAAAAVGMLEPIPVAKANAFCGGFYPALFSEIDKALGQRTPLSLVELEWATALRAARLDICGSCSPDQERFWALPVLYVRPDPFRLLLQPPPQPVQMPGPPPDTSLVERAGDLLMVSLDRLGARGLQMAVDLILKRSGLEEFAGRIRDQRNLRQDLLELLLVLHRTPAAGNRNALALFLSVAQSVLAELMAATLQNVEELEGLSQALEESAPQTERPLSPADLQRVDEVTAFLRALPPETPARVRAQALDLLTDIPPHLRPDANGQLSEPSPSPQEEGGSL